MIVSCGESLIDFVPVETAAGGIGYRPVVGGSPFNVAVTAGRLGARAGFLGRISTDLFGDMIMAELAKSRVADRFIERSDDPSTLSFVSLPEEGEPRYAFFGTHAADRQLSAGQARSVLTAKDVSCLHFGSFSLAVDPVGPVLADLAEAADDHTVISLDPNIRETLIPDRQTYGRLLSAWIGRSDIVKVSVADIRWLHPTTDPVEVACQWSRGHPVAVIVTCGGEGAIVCRHGSVAFRRPGRSVEVVDTVGAGDSFQGGLLARLQSDGFLQSREKLALITDDALATAVAFAIGVSGVTCSRQGADPPWAEEMQAASVV